MKRMRGVNELDFICLQFMLEYDCQLQRVGNREYILPISIRFILVRETMI